MPQKHLILDAEFRPVNNMLAQEMKTINKYKDKIQTITLDSFAAYIEFVEKECTEKYILYRGQRENTATCRDLLPKIARTALIGPSLIEKEQQIFNDFKKKAIPYIEKNIPAGDWEWLTLAQHHGLPTRLLDWSRNPLAALWFVVKKAPKNYKSYGVVWIFKPSDKDFIDFAKDKSPFDIKRTKVFEPSHIARRITAQSACFTAHKYLDNKSKFIPLNKNVEYKNKLIRIIVPGNKFKSLKAQLDRCGINDATLFADLDSLCRYMTWKELK